MSENVKRKVVSVLTFLIVFTSQVEEPFLHGYESLRVISGYTNHGGNIKIIPNAFHSSHLKLYEQKSELKIGLLLITNQSYITRVVPKHE